jgi:SAM-dependent methyltransferase
MRKAAQRWVESGDGSLIARNVSPVRSGQCSSRRAALEVLGGARRGRPRRVLDLGCGTGTSRKFMLDADETLHWFGVDIDDSPEVRLRPRRDLPLVTFDGVRIPFATGSLDFVYAHQVFEHVRHPERLLAEVRRVLADDGVFVGSTSQLEPFHSRSRCNFTAFGFRDLLEAAGFTKIEIRPGMDGLTLTIRRAFSFAGLARPFDFFAEHESPFNFAIELAARVLRLEARVRALLKLVFAGQFVFIARK